MMNLKNYFLGWRHWTVIPIFAFLKHDMSGDRLFVTETYISRYRWKWTSSRILIPARLPFIFPLAYVFEFRNRLWFLLISWWSNLRIVTNASVYSLSSGAKNTTMCSRIIMLAFSTLLVCDTQPLIWKFLVFRAWYNHRLVPKHWFLYDCQRFLPSQNCISSNAF